MKILIIGAGVLGSIYAAKLTQAGRDVTLLARGARLAQLREHGIVLESSYDGAQSVARVNLVETLRPEDEYDLALVIMRQNQAASVLPMLAANTRIPAVAFLMNNADGGRAFRAALGDERVLLGFAGAGGLRREHVVVVSTGKKGFEGLTILGEARGGITPRLVEFAEVFAGSGLEAQLETDVDAWLKSHLAIVLPLALGIYAANGDVYRAARTRAARALMVRGIKEGISGLKRLGVQVTPPKFHFFAAVPDALLVWFLSRMLATRFTEISLAGHANAARDEMSYLSEQFYALLRSSGAALPAWERLYAFTDEQTALIPDGAKQIG